MNICRRCGKETLNSKYCSRRCQQIYYNKNNPSWNKNLTKETDKRVKAISDNNKGNKIWLGRHHTQKTKDKISLKNKGKTPWLGKHHTEKTKNKMSDSGKIKIFSKKHRENMSEAGKKKVFTSTHRENLRKATINLLEKLKFKPSQQEILVKNYLLSQNLIEGIDFKYQHPIRNIKHKCVVDFCLLKLNTIMELDGVWFHANDNNIKETRLTEQQKKQIYLDGIRTKEMRNNGMIVLRFWQSDITNKFNWVTEQINNMLKIGGY